MASFDERDKWHSLRTAIAVVADDRLAEVEDTERAIALKVLGTISTRQARYAQLEINEERAEHEHD